METYTIKIDKRTKIGKTFLQIINSFRGFKKGVEITKEHTQADLNEESKKAMEEVERGIGITKYKDAEDMFEKLGI